jgi:hypothetical protein
MPRTRVVRSSAVSRPIATTPMASCAATVCAVPNVNRPASRVPIARDRSAASRLSPAIHSRRGRFPWVPIAPARRTTRPAPAFRLLLPVVRAHKGAPTRLVREPVADLPTRATITRVPARARLSRVASGTAAAWVLAAGASMAAATIIPPRNVPGSPGVLGTPPAPHAAGPHTRAPRTPPRRAAGTSRDAPGPRLPEGRAAGPSTRVARTALPPPATRSRVARGRPQPLPDATAPRIRALRTLAQRLAATSRDAAGPRLRPQYVAGPLTPVVLI